MIKNPCIQTCRTFARVIAFGACAAGTFLMCATAQAADLPQRALAPAYSPPLPFSWTGVYLGAQIGYAAGHDKVDDLLTSNGSYLGVTNRYTTKGLLGGLNVGADYQFGSLVVGVVADAELSDLKGNFNDPAVLPFNPGTIGHFKVGGQGSLRGRLGFAYERFMVYATGGAAFAQMKYTYFNPTAALTENKNSTRTGWTAGVGIDYAVTDRIIVGAEYRYTDFGKFNNVSTIAFPGLTGQENSRNNSGRVAVRFKF